MVSRRIVYWLAACYAPLAPLRGRAQEPLSALQASGSSIQAVQDPQERDAALMLLEHARSVFNLRSSGQAYDLQARLRVNSGGQTRYDGEWNMEDVFDPREGLRWTASLPGSYAITRIASHGMRYGEETDSYVPLRLHEARAALFDPLPSQRNLQRAAIRRAPVTFNGQQLTCLLISNGASANPSRAWNETEACVDPESGLLRVQSQVPGRYYTYDYSNAFQFGGHPFPRNAAVYEAGRVVTRISVAALKELPPADPALFEASDAMKANGRQIALGPAEKIFRVSTVKAGAPVGTVCIFGLVTASGELVEAHPLQPSNPNAQAAMDAAKKLNFSRPAMGAPQQYFVFILERFVASP